MHILIIVAVVVLGGGASFMAESSVPGDVLYVVKTSVNEEVRGMLAVGAEADAKWEAELAVRRLEEAAELEERGELDAETSAKLNAEFTAHAEAALEAAMNIGSSGQDGVSVAEEIRTTIDAALQLHGEVLAPRDRATGMSTGRVQSGDVNGDGAVEVTTGTKTDDDNDGAGDAGASVELKAGYDVKANTR